MFHSSIVALFETFFTLKNIYLIQFVMRSETRVDRRVTLALLSGSNRQWNELTDFS
jgi:hypothetical protein